MALNRKQKKNMKTYAIIAGVLVAGYWLVFKTVSGKSFVNSLLVKIGIPGIK